MIRRSDLPGLRLLFARFVRPHLAIIVLASFLGLLIAALTTLQPLILAPIIDTATAAPPPATSWGELTLNNFGATWLAWSGQGARSWRVVVSAVLAYVGLVTVASLLGFLNSLLISRVRVHLFRDLQETGYTHLIGLDMSYFVRARAGEFGSRLNSDALKVAQTVEAVIRSGIQNFAQLTLSALLLVRTSARLTLGVLVAFAVHFLITRVLRDRIRALVAHQVNLFAELAGRIHETILGIRIVKSFGAERFELARFVDRARKLERVMIRDGAYKHLELPLREIADAAGLAVVLLMAFAALLNNQLSLSGFVLFVALARRSLTPAARLAEAALLIQTALGSAARLLALLAETPSVRDGACETAPLRECIRLEHVHFAYPGEPPALQDISLEIHRGEVVALIGPSGAGKSTLVDLILRLYDPSAGQITWDGVPVRDFRQASYRQRFGVVSQEALIFNATVAENIAFGRPLDHAAIADAARIAHLDRFVGALPSGYDTVVGERGTRLSGGERQRLAIARALYDKPDVLVFDEATSALDNDTEASVLVAIDAIERKPIVIVIAHRLSTVVRADRLFVLDDGRICAVGTHEELHRTSALYRRLCSNELRATPKEPVHAPLQ